MANRIAFIVGLFSLLVVPLVAAAGEFKVVAYVPTWVDLPTYAPTIDYAKVTHINVAFANPTNDDGDLPFDPKIQPLIEQAHKHKVKILISIGGGSAAGDRKLLKRYSELLADKNRPAFVAKIVAFITTHDFDGLDVDLEGPAINKQYGPFIKDLSAALKPKGKLLTAALSKGYGGKDVPDAALQAFDFINVMAYDATGPWNPKEPGQHSSMEFAKQNVAYWVGRGLPKSKVVLGLPFYGVSFHDGTARPYTYSEIVAKYPGSEQNDEAGKTIWYNGIPTMRAKTRYAKDEQLAGVMIWSLDQDAKGAKSLLSAIDAAAKSK